VPGKRFSFPKSRRLTEAWQFDQVRKKGRAQGGTLLMVAALTGAEVDGLRAGFVTSRKIGAAAVRNRVRRRLREIVRKHQHEILDAAWVVTVARPSAARASYDELEDEWLRLAKRAFILAP
jgi:ribonuclease P protein component